MESVVPPSLVEGVELLSLDAGNTVVFLDHARLAGAARELGALVTREALVSAEGRAKARQEQGTLFRPPFRFEGEPGAPGWAAMVGTMLVEAGAELDGLGRVLERLWEAHIARNFWSAVPAGLAEALRALRAARVPVVIVSNSEGRLRGLFEQIGITDCFDRIVDSGLLGVEKPDPAIFREALAPFGVPSDRALHLGDSIATDVVGARNAGLRVALIDPFGQSEGRALDVPRVPGAAEVARALLAARRAPSSSRAGVRRDEP